MVRAAASGDQHEIDPAHPMSAHHSTDAICTPLSLLPGALLTQGAGVALATTATKLVRRGDGPTSIEIRTSETGSVWRVASEPALHLSLDDARDLLTVLAHLLAQADAAEAHSERNAFLLGVDAGQAGYVVADDHARRPQPDSRPEA